MAHLQRDNKKLTQRINRIQGQLNAVKTMLENPDSADCADLLQVIAACRGAINGLMAEVIEGHVLYHVLDPETKTSNSQVKAARQLLDVVKAYLK